MKDTTDAKLTSRWQTICTIGFQGSVKCHQNRAAHGGVCHLQARRARDGRIMARRVNSNGRHEEIGGAYVTDAETIAHWRKLGR